MSRRYGGRLYRRRRPWPAIIIVVLLAAAGVTVWVNVLGKASNSTVQSSCAASPHAPAGLPVITPLPYSALNSVRPIPATQVRVRTLNSSTQTGLAGRISLELAHYGFAQLGTGDDPRYPQGDMKCFGQIRFGPNGAAAARTLSLVVPCAQLVRDTRQDSSVDLALGKYFTDLAPSPDAVQVLNQLADWAAHHPAANGGLQSAAGQAPAVSSQLLAGAHTFGC